MELDNNVVVNSDTDRTQTENTVKNDTIIHYLFIGSFIQQFSRPPTMSGIVGWLINLTHILKECVLLRRIRHVPLINSPARWRKWSSKSAKPGTQAVLGSTKGSIQFGWYLSSERRQSLNVWRAVRHLPCSPTFFLPHSRRHLGCRVTDYLNLGLSPSLRAKQTFLQIKISYLLAVKHKESRRATSQNSQGAGCTGEFQGQLCCG